MYDKVGFGVGVNSVEFVEKGADGSVIEPEIGCVFRFFDLPFHSQFLRLASFVEVEQSIVMQLVVGAIVKSLLDVVQLRLFVKFVLLVF